MDLIEALEMAIKDEQAAVEKYRCHARQAEQPENRLLFEQLAREEETHLARLTERLQAIKLLGFEKK